MADDLPKSDPKAIAARRIVVRGLTLGTVVQFVVAGVVLLFERWLGQQSFYRGAGVMFGSAAAIVPIVGAGAFMFAGMGRTWGRLILSVALGALATFIGAAAANAITGDGRWGPQSLYMSAPIAAGLVCFTAGLVGGARRWSDRVLISKRDGTPLDPPQFGIGGILALTMSMAVLFCLVRATHALPSAGLTWMIGTQLALMGPLVIWAALSPTALSARWWAPLGVGATPIVVFSCATQSNYRALWLVLLYVLPVVVVSGVWLRAAVALARRGGGQGSDAEHGDDAAEATSAPLS